MSNLPEDEARQERVHALLTPVVLPEVTVDLATFRRLTALHTRIREGDPGGGGSEIEFEDAIYVAISSGLRADEERSDVHYNENTGFPIERPRSLWQRVLGAFR